MGFSYHSFDKGGSPAIEYLPVTAEEVYAVGELLNMGSGGTATKCSGTGSPTHLCVGPADERGCVPATRISEDTIYDAPLTAAGTSLKLGNKVTISADGLGVTATTTSGVAEIVRMDGTAVGDTVGVRFTVSANITQGG